MHFYSNADRDLYALSPEPGMSLVEDAALREERVGVSMFVLPSAEQAEAFSNTARALFHEFVFGFGKTYPLQDGRVALIFTDRSEEYGDRCRTPGLRIHGL